MTEYLIRGSGRKQRVLASGDVCLYSSVSESDTGSGVLDLDIAIPAGGLAIVWWSIRSSNSGDVVGNFTVTEVTGSATVAASDGKAADNFFSASGGGWIYSAGGGTFTVHLDVDNDIAGGALHVIVGADCQHEQSFGG